MANRLNDLFTKFYINGENKSFKNKWLMIKLSMRLQLGGRFWLLPSALLLWPLFHWLRLVLDWKAQDFVAADAQNFLIGFPLYAAAIALGSRLIANEIERRTLEVGYTIPNGVKKLWLAKLGAVSLLIIVATIALALITKLLLTNFPLMAVYGALQGAIFYLVLAMMFGAWFKSELMAAIAAYVILAVNVFKTQSLWSPLYNSLNNSEISGYDKTVAMVQNHIGYGLVIVALCLLAFYMVESREKMLAS